MELLGMLQHLASWRFLLVVAVLDVFLILQHLAVPGPRGAPSLLPTLPRPPSVQDGEHARLLERVLAEREKVGEEMKKSVREIRAVSRSLKFRAQVLDSLSQSIGRLERTIRSLQGQQALEADGAVAKYVAGE